MKIIADTHCHTIASSHAYGTILENAKDAKLRGLKYMAVTDHFGDIPGAPGSWYFHNLKILPKEIEGVRILRGIESNVLGPSGRIDIPEFKPGMELDWVVASIHEIPWVGGSSIEDCTNAWINVAENPVVNVIGHSGLINFKYDYEKVIPIFKKNNKLVEINASSFKVRPGCYDNCKKIAEVCKKYNAYVIVNSDAHFAYDVGNFKDALDLLNEVDFPENLIINANLSLFEQYLEKFTPFFD